MAWACISASGSKDVKVKAGFCLTIIQALCDLDSKWNKSQQASKDEC